jgi:hypothetical protein
MENFGEVDLGKDGHYHNCRPVVSYFGITGFFSIYEFRDGSWMVRFSNSDVGKSGIIKFTSQEDLENSGFCVFDEEGIPNHNIYFGGKYGNGTGTYSS